MGSDLTVVNAARVSFNKQSVWGQKNPSGGGLLESKDIKLIDYLAKNGHWTPFGHPQLQFHFKMPIFVARQFMRSNVGICYNEVSRRYVDSEPEFHTPEAWRGRPTNGMKQGSSGTNDLGMSTYDQHMYDSLTIYRMMIEGGVAPEMTRMVLPLSTYTEFWATMSLAASARVVNLRKDKHAQWEVQQYAHAMSKLIAPLFPVSWAALMESPECPASTSAEQ